LEITEKVIPHIEKAIGFKLYDEQKRNLLNKGYYTIGGRGTGKTVVYCIKLILSDGEPLDMKNLHKFSDYGDGSRRYACGFFRREFLEYRRMLKEYGFPVRDIKF
jgi:hypothetical protein